MSRVKVYSDSDNTVLSFSKQSKFHEPATEGNLSHDLSVFRTYLINYSDYNADIPERLKETLWKSKVCFAISASCLLKCSNILQYIWGHMKQCSWVLLHYGNCQLIIAIVYNYRQECAWKFQYSIKKTQSTSLCNYFICQINKCLVLIPQIMGLLEKNRHKTKCIIQAGVFSTTNANKTSWS